MNEDLASILAFLYPNTRPGVDWSVRQSSPTSSPVIAEWNVAGVSKPAEADVLAQRAAYQAAPSDWYERYQAQNNVVSGSAVYKVIRNMARLVLGSVSPTRDKVNELTAQVNQLTLQVNRLAAGLAAQSVPSTPIANLPANRDWPSLINAQKQLIQNEQDPAAG